MNLQESNEADGFYSLRLYDRVNDIDYVGFATEHEEGEDIDIAEFWIDLFDNKMPNALINHKNKENSIPAIIILPSQDVDSVYIEANKRGAYPARYQLFEKFTVLAFNTVDSAAIRAYMQGQVPEIPVNKAKTSTKSRKWRYIAAAVLFLAIGSIVAAKQAGLFDQKPKSELVDTSDPYWAVRSPNSEDRAAIAADSSIPAMYLRLLARDEDERVRLAVASNSALTEDVLDMLSRDASPSVRDRVVSHPLVTATIRSRVYPDVSLAPCDVREKIYAGGSVTPDMLALAGQGGDTCAKRGVSQNSNTALDVLTDLTRDEDVWVRAHATQSIRNVVGFPSVFDTAMRDFTHDVELLVRDVNFQRELKQAGNDWEMFLRRTLNSTFRTKIYDPLGMDDMEDSPMSFEIFLADSGSSSNNAYAALVARTADNIVSNTLNAVTPYLGNIMADRATQNTPLFSEEFLAGGVQQLEELELEY
jgi:hypothetical protein